MDHHPQLRSAASGDDEALAALVRDYHDRVYRFGVAVCHDRFDADDAVQEAFIKLARRPDVMANPGALGWLLRVVRTTCIKLMRPFARERRALGERSDDPIAAPGDPQQLMERWELVRAVHDAISQLPPLYREVLILRDLEGLSGEQTCAALGIELPAMKTRLHRARAMLRNTITATTHQETP
jgi:RNA polymerase sigma-70 factor, ECF subfamily